MLGYLDLLLLLHALQPLRTYPLSFESYLDHRASMSYVGYLPIEHYLPGLPAMAQA